MIISHRELYVFTERNIKQVTKLVKMAKSLSESLSVDFPGYEGINTGSYFQSFIVTLFLDIRGSTERAIQIGAKKTFVTLSTLLPSLAKIVTSLEGFVVDFPGDGIMAHWISNDTPNTDKHTIQRAMIAAEYMDDCVKSIVNPLLSERRIPEIRCGIGIDGGKVIITRIGIPGSMSTKAIGDSVNNASKLASSNMGPDGGIFINKVLADIAFPDGRENIVLHYELAKKEKISKAYIDNLLKNMSNYKNNVIHITSSSFFLPDPRQE